MKHDIDWHRQWYRVGDMAAIYPNPWRGSPFVGVVEKIKINKYKRISYVVNETEWLAEELFPERGQEKLKIRARGTK